MSFSNGLEINVTGGSATDLSDYFKKDGTVAMTGDIDTGNNDLKMGTGLVGYGGTASKGLSFDSGNEKVTLESGQFLIPCGTKALPAIAFTDNQDMGLYCTTNGMVISINDFDAFFFYTTILRGSSGGFIKNIVPSTTQVGLGPNKDDENTGVGWAGADKLSLIAGGKESMRVETYEDTTLADSGTLATIASGVGVVYIKNTTDNELSVIKIENTTVTAIDLNANHSTTKDNGGTLNFYWDTDKFYIQNKLGVQKSVRATFTTV